MNDGYILENFFIDQHFISDWWQAAFIPTSGGLHDNTEHTTYDSTDYLKCSHNGDVLTGNYTSEVFDIGAVEAANKHLIYIVPTDSSKDFIVVTGEGLTWADKFSTTWGAAQAADKTWEQILNLTAASRIGIRLYYDTSTPPTNYIDKFEILSAIIPATNRYFRVKITITDPNADVNGLVQGFTLKFCTYS